MRIEDTIPERIRKVKKVPHGGDSFRYTKVIDFSNNVNPFGPSKSAKEALEKAIGSIQEYPDPNATSLKESITEYMGVSPENITLGNGSTELIKNFCEVFINKGDRVVLPVPTFSEYRVYLGLYGAKVKTVPLDEDFTLPLQKVKDAMVGARAIFLCNPNNPTGQLISEEDLREILDRACDYGTLVFLDEAYMEFTGGIGLSRQAAEGENIFILRSLTKYFSLAGLRVGFGVANGEMIKYMEKVRIPWNINRFAMEAAVASLEDRVFMETSLEKIRKEREYLRKGLEDMFPVIASDANFFLVSLQDKVVSAPELKTILIGKGILIRDGSTIEGLDTNWFRVSIRKREDNRRLLKALEEIF